VGILGKVFGGVKGLVGKGLKLAGGVGLSSLPGGGLIKKGIDVGSKIAGRIGRKNLKRLAVGGAVVGAGAIAATTGGGGPVMTPGQAASIGMTPGHFGRHRRRINPGNIRAMRRAVRRVEAGAKMFHRLFGITHKNIKGAPGVHVKRHRKAA